MRNWNQNLQIYRSKFSSRIDDQKCWITIHNASKLWILSLAQSQEHNIISSLWKRHNNMNNKIRGQTIDKAMAKQTEPWEIHILKVGIGGSLDIPHSIQTVPDIPSRNSSPYIWKYGLYRIPDTKDVGLLSPGYWMAWTAIP